METAVLRAAYKSMSQTLRESADSAERYYFSALARGQFMIPRCLTCDAFHFYPRVLCPHCGADTLQWLPASGRGVVYATTTVRTKGGSHNVCLVDLQEGPRLMSSVVDLKDCSDVHIGMAVQASIRDADSNPLLVFVAAEELK